MKTLFFWLLMMQPQQTNKPTAKIIWFKYTPTEGYICKYQKKGYLPKLWIDNNRKNKVSYL